MQSKTKLMGSHTEPCRQLEL